MMKITFAPVKIFYESIFIRDVVKYAKFLVKSPRPKKKKIFIYTFYEISTETSKRFETHVYKYIVHINVHIVLQA